VINDAVSRVCVLGHRRSRERAGLPFESAKSRLPSKLERESDALLGVSWRHDDRVMTTCLGQKYIPPDFVHYEADVVFVAVPSELNGDMSLSLLGRCNEKNDNKRLRLRDRERESWEECDS